MDCSIFYRLITTLNIFPTIPAVSDKILRIRIRRFEIQDSIALCCRVSLPHSADTSKKLSTSMPSFLDFFLLCYRCSSILVKYLNIIYTDDRR